MSFRAPALLAAAIALCATSSASGREEGAVTVHFRGGGLLRDDRGYLSHARAFDFGIAGGGGGAFEVGVEGPLRFSVHASVAGYSGAATRRDARLTLGSSMWMFHLRWAFYRHTLETKHGPLMWQGQLSYGIGRYSIYDRYEDSTSRPDDPIVRSAQSGGWRAGVDASVYWHWAGFVLGWAYHRAPASVTDRISGSVTAGGHEITAGLSLRF